MTQIYGQIESLKQIRATLNRKGIDRFGSINQIKNFLDSYELEKKKIYQKHENKLEDDIVNLKESDKQNHLVLEKLRNECIDQLDAKINLNLKRINKLNELNVVLWIIIIFVPIAVLIMQLRVKYLQKNYHSKIEKKTLDIKRIINRDQAIIYEYTSNKEEVLKARSLEETKELAYIKEAVLELKPLIAGAIGENLVVKEIEKLSDEYILINDFAISFNPPIYNKKKMDRIHSIQIDHLVLSQAGIFVIETKNWSKKSVESFDLRSPIKQIKRTSYALFVLLNNSNTSSSIALNYHHWGDKKIPIRNVIAMINHKPKEKFKYVAVKKLNELNPYLAYFEPIFRQAEVESIAHSLMKLNN